MASPVQAFLHRFEYGEQLFPGLLLRAPGRFIFEHHLRNFKSGSDAPAQKLVRILNGEGQVDVVTGVGLFILLYDKSSADGEECFAYRLSGTQESLKRKCTGVVIQALVG